MANVLNGGKICFIVSVMFHKRGIFLCVVILKGQHVY